MYNGTHIPLKATTVNSQDYYNHKQFYSLNAQEGCDYKGYFTDVACRWPGNCHDVYGYSNINRKMQQKEIPIIYKQKIPGKAKIANYLIGDPTYPLTLFCMKGDESCKSDIQSF